MSIKAEAISQFYGSAAALDQVTLELSRGGFTLICGRNGSGKSTLLKCLSGLQKPSSGKVMIEGEPAARARGKVGLAIQFPERALFGRTVYDDLAFFPKNAGLGPAKVEGRVAMAAEATGLSAETLARHHSGLSYGQKRLAGLASILSGTPGYLFLDEPTAGLDYDGKRRVRGILQGLSISGVTIVIASHDPSLFLDLCDRLILLESGRVVVDSAPEKVDLNRAGIRSDTLELSRQLNRCGFRVTETFSPEALAASIAEVLRRESAGHS